MKKFYSNHLFFSINLLVFLIFALVIKNYIDQHNQFTRYEKQNFKKFSTNFLKENSQDGFFYFYDKKIKKRFSENISSKKNYDFYFDRKCEITGDFSDRHRVRWVLKYFEFKIFNSLFSLQKDLPYFAYIIIYGLITWLGFFLCMSITGYSWKNVCLYLFAVSFIFQHNLSEIGYSVIETAMLALALYASFRKEILLFIFAVVFASLNRESGIVISLVWLVFNKKYIFPLLVSIFSGIILLIVNFDIIECLLKPKFFLPLEKQSGQFSISDVGDKIGYASLIRVIINNFLIPLGITFYLFIFNKNKNNPLFYIICFYYIIFFVATPLHHISVKMISVPLIVLLSNPKILEFREK